MRFKNNNFVSSFWPENQIDLSMLSKKMNRHHLNVFYGDLFHDLPNKTREPSCSREAACVKKQLVGEKQSVLEKQPAGDNQRSSLLA